MGQDVDRTGSNASTAALEPLLLPVLHHLARKGAQESILNKFSLGLSCPGFPASGEVDLAGGGGWRGFLRGRGLIRWCKVDLAGLSRFQSWKDAEERRGRWRAREATVSVKRSTDEQMDDIVKAYDPRFDLLLLEGEENNMQN